MYKKLNEVDQEGFESWTGNDKWEHRPNIKNAKKRDGSPTNMFYASDAWKQLREEVLLHYGKRCMKCKTHTKIIQVDHIKPRHFYPHLALDFNNMQVLWQDCNKEKGLGKSDYRKTI